MDTPPALDPSIPEKRRSDGGIQLLGGFILLLLAGFSACGDCLSLIEFAAFGFSFYGLVVAKGWPFRIAGMILSGLSGGIIVRGIIAYWNEW